MKRLGILMVALFLLTVTSAFAAGLDVESENVASFTSPVSIPVPGSKFFYLRSRLDDQRGDTPPGVLSEDANFDSGRTQSKGLVPGGSLTFPYGTSANQYHYWDTLPFGEDRRYKSPVAELLITQVGSAGELGAGLFDCTVNPVPAAPTCVLIGASDGAVRNSGGSVANITTVTFEDFDHTFVAGHFLRLVGYSKSGSYNIQWGYKENRPASLELTAL